MSSPPEECRKNADICLGMAERIHNPPDKDMWIRLANSWLKLARLEEEAEVRKSEGFHPLGGRAGSAETAPASRPPPPDGKTQPSVRMKKRKAG
jgi:hypothetical protein